MSSINLVDLAGSERADRTGATVRRIPLYETLDGMTEDALADSVMAAVQPNTRVVALTWVHSSTGLKMPIAQIGARLARLNAGRGPDDRILLCGSGARRGGAVSGIAGHNAAHALLELLGH